MTSYDWDNHLLDLNWFFYKLLSCPMCLSFSVSIFVTLIGFVIFMLGGLAFQIPFFIVSLAVFVHTLFPVNTGEIEKTVKVKPSKLKDKPVDPIISKPVKKEKAKTGSYDKLGVTFDTFSDGTVEIAGVDKDRDKVLQIFQVDYKCPTEECKTIVEAYHTEVTSSAATHGGNCPACLENSIKVKYYNQAKALIL